MLVEKWGELMRLLEDPKSTPDTRRFASRALLNIAYAMGWHV